MTHLYEQSHTSCQRYAKLNKELEQENDGFSKKLIKSFRNQDKARRDILH